jgi:hypothetical protein
MAALTSHVALVSESDSVSLDQLSSVAAALQKQVTRDFGPIWSVDATVDAFNSLDSVPVDYWPIILRDDINEPGAAGYHTDDNGQPFSLVQVDDTWPLTTSHEALEMLADPFGNRTIAGAPPKPAPAKLPRLDRVTYLVEVCDPCEDRQFAYAVNGVALSDFITPHFYDPSASSGVRYSFSGNIPQPHQVLDGGYVSFGNPVDNHWYQIMVKNGHAALRDLGIIQNNGKSIREWVDTQVREARRSEHYRTKPATPRAVPAAQLAPFSGTNAGRAKKLHEYIAKIKTGKSKVETMPRRTEAA